MSEYLKRKFEENQALLNQWLEAEHLKFKNKIIVLDDDPTGSQTVNDVPIYTSWNKEQILNIFSESSQMVFILTNSRSFSREKTISVHKQIINNLEIVANEIDSEYIVISRGDSTLRGHYPVEMDTIKDELAIISDRVIEGEFFCPAFFEGGRVTKNNIHYILKDSKYIPVAETEFARDKTFAYKSSNLKDYIIEKYDGNYSYDDIVSISSKDLAEMKIDKVIGQIEKRETYTKFIVNATDYFELRVFSLVILKLLNKDHNYLFRSAASLPKVLGNVNERDLLNKNEILGTNSNCNGGLIIVGSYVDLTTKQLQSLCESPLKIAYNLFDINADNYNDDITRISNNCNENIRGGITTVVYTSRNASDTSNLSKEEALKRSVQISKALTTIVSNIIVMPKYIIAKGGITSSDVATNGLNVKRAVVKGQIASGISTWELGDESHFPSVPYIVFPGNVGEIDSLKNIVSKLEE